MRNSFGLSAAEAAHRANIPMEKLNKWEQGKRKLKPDEYLSLAGLLRELQDQPDSNVVLAQIAGESGGAAAKQYREKHGIKQSDVARAMQLSPTTISLFEKGYLTFTAKQTVKLGGILDALKEQSRQTENEKRLFLEIEASLRREVSEKEAQSVEAEEGNAGNMMKLSSLVGGESTRRAFKGLRSKDREGE